MQVLYAYQLYWKPNGELKTMIYKMLERLNKMKIGKDIKYYYCIFKENLHRCYTNSLYSYFCIELIKK